MRIGDRVWFDTNQDGVQDAGERGIANVVVRLVRNNVTAVRARVVVVECARARARLDRRARQMTTSTDANGLYEFNSKAGAARAALARRRA